MPCAPLTEGHFNTDGYSPSSSSGGFAAQQPDFNIPFTPIDLSGLSDLFNTLNITLPPGKLQPTLFPNVINDVYGAVNSILEKFVPFLMLYKFFLPVLNLILCIIDVLCAIPNPFKLSSALIKLFRVCIPDFLALFPFFALILMIITLLLLIISLIAYLLKRILLIIKVIIANLIILDKAIKRADGDSIIAVVKKVGALLCLIQDLFVIFGILLAIVQVIKAMLGLSFSIPPCDDQDGSSSGCCTSDVCPDFIKNNSTITGTDGYFLYYNEVGIDSGLTLPVGFAPIFSVIRNESWQFYDPSLPTNKAFINITKAYDLPVGNTTVFFPSGVVYTKITNPNSTPYTISFRLLYNPSAFSIEFGTITPRYIRIVNAIVQSPPTAGVLNYNNTYIPPTNGTLNLVGGSITEDDGTPILDSNGNPISLNDFFHIPTTAGIPTPFDGILFSNITYTFSINHEILVANSLITLGCIPELAIAKNAINTTIGAQFNTNGINLAAVANLLPDVGSAQTCVANAITTYRASVSRDTTATFQNTITDCLNNLQAQCITALTATIAAGFDQYKSTFIIDPIIQFTTLPIIISVSLNESSGQLMTANIPTDAANALASQIVADVSLGAVSNFAYDGYGLFTANITSKDAGNGDIKVSFNNNFISILSNSTDLTQPVSVAIKELSYTFVKSSIFNSADNNVSDVNQKRRNEGDIARDVTNE